MIDRATPATTWQTWRDAARRPQIDTAIRKLWQEIDAAIAQRKPVCNTSGRCCRFDEFGHRLYVTGLEIAWVLEQHSRQDSPDASCNGLALPQFEQRGACRFQVDGLCSIHTIRPMGCRIFFCEAGTERWQQQLYETQLQRLRNLHDAHALPYVYMEWRAGLCEATATP